MQSDLGFVDRSIITQTRTTLIVISHWITPIWSIKARGPGTSASQAGQLRFHDSRYRILIHVVSYSVSEGAIS
jgi:hypothetical protein